MRLLSLLLGLLLSCSLWANPISAPQLLQLVDYVGVDYEEAVDAQGNVKNPSEYQEMQEFSAAILSAVEALPAQPEKQDLLVQAKQLQKLVNEVAPILTVRDKTQQLSIALREVLTVTLTPAQLPDIALGKKIFQTNCVACHGATGAGDGVLAASLNPPPTNFLDRQRMDHLSIFALYNTVTLGVAGTSMAPYGKALTEEERWSVAFYLSGLVDTEAQKMLGKKAWKEERIDTVPDLNTLTTVTVNHLNEEGQALLAYLRANPEAMMSQDPFAITLEKLGQSMKYYEAGNAKEAYQYALSAYLDGFETAEAILDVMDRDQRILIEQKMMAFRMAIEKKQTIKEVQNLYDELYVLLTTVQDTLPTLEFTSPAIFLSSFVILLREGLESILLVGMLIVMLVKGERRELLPAVHIGWLVALAAGAATWFVSNALIEISGAARELTEGVTAIVAAGILLYVGIWIHRHQLARDWRTYLKEKLAKHLDAEKARWGLATLSFLAVYRELFETILFYETLSLQVGMQHENMIWFGAVAALAILLFVVFLMFRFGLQLPIQTFFRVSTWLIFLFAIIFIGQGIHGLEEAGKVPVWPVSIPRIDLLGIYPNLFGLLCQAAALGLAIVMGIRRR